MPIKIPNKLPARPILEKEGVPVISEGRALSQDIRPLQLLILNLMPNKIDTEIQLLRGFGVTPLQLEVTFLNVSTHESKNTSKEHLQEFYQTHEQIKDRKFDAFIMTGAPLGLLDFNDVSYWEEIKVIMDWADSHVYSSLFICWGALAALYHHYDINKLELAAKKMGVYRQKVLTPTNPLICGFDDFFYVPVARQTEINSKEVSKHPDLEMLAESDEGAPCLLEDKKRNRVFMSNHLEYEAETLKKEYERDKLLGINPPIPHNYFPDDDINAMPEIIWRAHRSLLFSNWINTVYQNTPFDINEI